MRSIRWRLVASYMALTVLAVGLVAALALSLIRRHAEQQELNYLTANAQSVARQVAALMSARPAGARANLYALRQIAHTAAFAGNVRVKVLDAQERVIVDSGPLNAENDMVWVLPPEPSNELLAETANRPILLSMLLNRAQPVDWRALPDLPADVNFLVVRRVEGAWGNRFVINLLSRVELEKLKPEETGQTSRSDLVVRLPIGETGRPLGYVELSEAPDFGSEAVDTTARALGLAGLGATMLAGVAGLLIGRTVTAPLQSLSRAADRMSKGDLSARAAVNTRDEIGQLGAQFDRMADQLQRSFADLEAERDTLRRFVADASHELRTPITALKAFNELLQGPAAEDAAVRAEFLAESQRQIDRLQWITENLLNLSRLDAGLVQLEWSDHDAREMAQAVIAAFRPLAADKHITLTWDAPDQPVIVHCDRARIEMALGNLVDNALKFTPAGGQVVVSLNRRMDETVFAVQDTGVGIDPDDLPRIFDRFYRSRAARGAGSGLGLAIVKSIAQAHHGRVTVTSEPGKGSRFELIVPCPSAGS
ncbi:MAG: HAMP domain-containing sensor histidine kinase [Anaerolineae bacterium]|nr:HAMP domain-containing histidine kinase [Thermoflexales bacterium]MDW8407650.1 HAMP domain-containing sensor histidine kinase [Anaerolineae bacterium]